MGESSTSNTLLHESKVPGLTLLQDFTFGGSLLSGGNVSGSASIFNLDQVQTDTTVLSGRVGLVVYQGERLSETQPFESEDVYEDNIPTLRPIALNFGGTLLGYQLQSVNISGNSTLVEGTISNRFETTEGYLELFESKTESEETFDTQGDTISFGEKSTENSLVVVGYTTSGSTSVKTSVTELVNQQSQVTSLDAEWNYQTDPLTGEVSGIGTLQYTSDSVTSIGDIDGDGIGDSLITEILLNQVQNGNLVDTTYSVFEFVNLSDMGRVDLGASSSFSQNEGLVTDNLGNFNPDLVGTTLADVIDVNTLFG